MRCFMLTVLVGLSALWSVHADTPGVGKSTANNALSYRPPGTRTTESKGGLFGNGGLRSLWRNSGSATKSTGFRPSQPGTGRTTAQTQKPFLQRLFGR